MRLALYQPDIPQNVGTLLRTAACLGVPVDIILPCGFPFSDKALRRSGMDYMGSVDMTTHADWDAFLAARPDERLVLLTTKATHRADTFDYEKRDILLLGRESSGVPENVHKRADARIRLPMLPGMRSLNIAIAGAMSLTLGCDRTGTFAQLE